MVEEKTRENHSKGKAQPLPLPLLLAQSARFYDGKLWE
jgi:hypothetical protein